MNKNTNLSALDPNQMARATFSEKNDATRVEIVAGPELKLDVNTDTITSAIKEGMKELKIEATKIEVPVVVKETQFERIEIPVIIKETVFEKIEVPVYVKEIERVEIPVLPPPEIQIVEIKTPVIVKELQEFKYVNYMLIIQTIVSILMLANLFRR